eukprot:c10480_g1_i1.p1 GENE.c10480_g1_i1~~c10480_g1_i1.p1  ORF type:complete len:431 (-),score=72.18 c10480_g1_i1:343-1635(-)
MGGCRRMNNTQAEAMGDKQDMFRCPLCLDVFSNQIVECPECFEVFCMECVTKAFTTKQSCPLCRKTTTSPSSWHRNLAIERRVGNLVLECENRKNGCNVAVTRFTKTEHEISCEFSQVKCSLGCGGVQCRKDLAEHESSSCIFRKKGCSQECGVQVRVCEEEVHIAKDCVNTMIDCPNSCGEKTTRGSMHFHTAQCQLQPLDCLYKEQGCNERILRKDFDEHISKPIHNKYSSMLITRLLGEISRLKDENDHLKRDLIEVQNTHTQIIGTTNLLCMKVGVSGIEVRRPLLLSTPPTNTNTSTSTSTSTTAPQSTSDEHDASASASILASNLPADPHFQVGDCVKVENAGHLYPTIGRIPDHSGLESWPSEEIKKHSINAHWKRRHGVGDVGVVVHVTKHALARNEVAIVKIENDYVCVAALGLSPMPALS